MSPSSTSTVPGAPAKKRVFKLAAVVISLFFCAVLLLAGELCARLLTNVNFLGTDKNLFVPAAFGQSKGNAKRYHGDNWGVMVDTDENGFRYDPTYSGPEPTEALLILGDSVSFGGGVPAEKTFAGLLQRRFPRMRVYNSAVIGYGVRDYENVVREFIPRHPEVRHVLLVLCLNDLMPDSAQMIDQELAGRVAAKPPAPAPNAPRPRPRALEWVNEYLRERSKLFLFVKILLWDPQLRYFKIDLQAYQVDDAEFEARLEPLLEAHRLLEQHGVEMTVIVSPYAAQLRQSGGSRVPQERVDRFLTAHGIHFLDAYDRFAKEKDAASLFLFGDPMHLSASGHERICAIAAEDLAPRVERGN